MRRSRGPGRHDERHSRPVRSIINTYKHSYFFYPLIFLKLFVTVDAVIVTKNLQFLKLFLMRS